MKKHEYLQLIFIECSIEYISAVEITLKCVKRNISLKTVNKVARIISKFDGNTSMVEIIKKQESIPVGCVPPTCKPYVFWWPPLGLSIRGGEVGPQVNK